MDIQIPEELPPPLGPAQIEKVAGSRPVRRQNRPHQMMGHRTKGGWADAVLMWEAPYQLSTVANLTSDITINGVTVSPSFRYEGKDATASNWPAVTGRTLAIASAGTTPTLTDTPLISTTDKCLQFASGKVYQDSGYDSSYEIDANSDFVFEFVLKVGNGLSPWLGTSPLNGGAGTITGWQVNSASTGSAFGFRFGNGVTQISSSTVVSGSGLNEVYAHFLVCCDRNENSTNGFRMYINGTLATAVNASALSGVSCASGLALTFGSDTGFAFKSNTAKGIIQAALYKSTGWFAGGATNATQWADFARMRAAYLFGMIPSVPYGTTVPTTMSRSGTACIDKIDPATDIRTLYLVGTGWPRLCYRKEVSGGEYFIGYLSELGCNQLFLQSTNLASASWTRTNLAAPTATAGPLFSTRVSNSDSAYNIIASAVNGQHGLLQAPTLTAATYVLSVWAKAGAKSWVNLVNTTLGLGCTFDVTNGAVGTITGAVINQGIEPWGNGWYRCWIAFTGTAVAHTLALRAATDTADNNYAGDGVTASVLMFGPQIENQGGTNQFGTGPTSFIQSATVTTARGSDRLDYTLSNIYFPCTLQMDVLGNYYTAQTQIQGSFGFPLSCCATLAGSYQTDAIALYLTRVGANLEGRYAATMYRASVAQANVIGTVTDANALSGEIQVVNGVFGTNDVRLFVDHVSQDTPDTSATPPTLTPGFMRVGVDQGTIRQSFCTIYRYARLWFGVKT